MAKVLGLDGLDAFLPSTFAFPVIFSHFAYFFLFIIFFLLHYT
jgi:hypothetical protein